MYYRIGEFAKLTGVSAKTLRFYDEVGLLRPAGTDPRTRYRHYLPQQLQDLATILALKELGVSLAEIRKVMDGKKPNCDRKEILRRLKGEMEQAIVRTRQSLHWVNAALRELEDSSSTVSVVVKQRSAIPVASLRGEGRHYCDILPLEQELLDCVPMERRGATRGILWHRCADAGVIDGEPFVELKTLARSATSYDIKQLPSATLACAYSAVDDEAAEQAYDALRRWMKRRGYRLAGAKREIYLGQMLEIQFPIQAV